MVRAAYWNVFAVVGMNCGELKNIRSMYWALRCVVLTAINWTVKEGEISDSFWCIWSGDIFALVEMSPWGIRNANLKCGLWITMSSLLQALCCARGWFWGIEGLNFKYIHENRAWCVEWNGIRDDLDTGPKAKMVTSQNDCFPSFAG